MEDTLNTNESGCKPNWVLRAVVIGVMIVLLWFIFALIFPIDYSMPISQKSQFHSIEVGLQMFKSVFDDYPPSCDNLYLDGAAAEEVSYGGAQKLAEALVGRDGEGFHVNSKFRSDGKGEVVCEDGQSKLVRLYGEFNGIRVKHEDDSLRELLFIDPDNANIFCLKDIYSEDVLVRAKLDPGSIVSCDEFWKKRATGVKTGMPILYYKADASKDMIDSENPDSPDNVYNYKDNAKLLGLGVPGEDGEKHPLADPAFFCEYIRNTQIKTFAKPFNSDSFILVSAGKDGVYGTDDDICNFEKFN